MAFKMNGATYSTMLAVAKELGKSRIYRKDFEKYGIEEISDEEVKAETTEEKAKYDLDKDDALDREYPGVSDEDHEDDEDEAERIRKIRAQEELDALTEEPAEEDDEEAEESDQERKAQEEADEAAAEEEAEAEEDADEDEEANETEEVKAEEVEPAKAGEKKPRTKMTDEEKKAKRAERQAKKRAAREEAKKPTPEMLEKAKALQEKAGFPDIWDWAVAMRKMNNDEVAAFADELGITWNRHESPKIDRMRAVAVIRENLYPGQKRPKVRQSKWRGVPITEIEELAKTNDVKYPETTNEKIKRMHLIKALKEAGVESPQ